MDEPKYLNIGCGARFCQGWVNLDVAPSHPSVQRCDISKGLPFSDSRFNLVYHSHLLEHLDKDAGKFLISECWRVLMPGGIVRVAVPDLETITSLYSTFLGEAITGVAGAQERYDWIMLELYDQTVRNVSGGEMARYLHCGDIGNLEFIRGRCGAEIAGIYESSRRGKAANTSRLMKSRNKGRNLSVRGLLEGIKENLVRVILKDDYQKLLLGRFKSSGEIHQWMYDRYSLLRLLEGAGFKNVVRREADSSYLGEWPSYHLDTEKDGSVRKPDSLFMEGIR